MEFIKKLLDRSRSEQKPAQPEIPTPQPETVTLAYHKSVVAIMSAKLTTARAEAAANAADAERYRARLKNDREYHQRRRRKKTVTTADGVIWTTAA